MDRKRLIEAIIAIVIGLFFISSYAGYVGLNNGTQAGGSSSTTTTVPRTNYAYGFANATILNFTQEVSVKGTCDNSTAALGRVSNISTSLESNGSVADSFASGSAVQVQMGSMPAVSFYNYSSSVISTTELSCLEFQGTATAQLPQAVNFTISGQHYPLQLSQSMRDYQVPLNLSYTGNTIRLKVFGLVEGNGTIYQINVTRG